MPAKADGSSERALLAPDSLDSNPSFPPTVNGSFSHPSAADRQTYTGCIPTAAGSNGSPIIAFDDQAAFGQLVAGREVDRVFFGSRHEACAMGWRMGVHTIDGVLHRSGRWEVAAPNRTGRLRRAATMESGRAQNRVLPVHSQGVYPGRFGRKPPAVSQIVSLDVETGVVHELTSGVRLKIAPQWLPEGELGFVQKFGDAKVLAFVSPPTGMHEDMRNPSWSPDGKTVVYQKEIDVKGPSMLSAFSRDPDFALYRTRNFFPAWSPLGDRFVATVGAELQMFNAEGENGRTLYDNKGGQVTFPSWSPDGKAMHLGLAHILRGMTSLPRSRS